MRAIRLNFYRMVSCVKQDMMLFAACFAPLLSGLFIKFAVPVLEGVLKKWLSREYILTPYYGMFDIFFSMLGPVMFCFVAAMVMLEENDDRIAAYLFITPLGKTGYLISRLGMPAGVGFIVTFVLLPVFKLTQLSFLSILFMCVGGTLQGIVMAMLVVSFSKNKLEGMAVTKLSTLTIVGVAVPYFTQHNMQYVLSLLPSFWIGKMIYHRELAFILPNVIIYLIWICFLHKRFMRKIL